MQKQAVGIPPTEMAELTRAGEAHPLMPEFDVSPTRYADRWWYVPSGHHQYVEAEPDKAAMFATILERSARMEALAARHMAAWRKEERGNT